MTDWLSETKAAAVLGIHRHTLRRWRLAGRAPPHHHPTPDVILYRRDDLDAWMRKLPGGNRAQPAQSKNQETPTP